MTRFRAYCFGAILLGLLACLAVPTAVAQTQGKAVAKHHQKIPAGKDCSSCHKKTFAEWKGGPHGANGVECTVCHGEITATTVLMPPALTTCAGCHEDKVAQLKSDPFMSEQHKTCVTCHPPHALKPHSQAAPAGK